MKRCFYLSAILSILFLSTITVYSQRPEALYVRMAAEGKLKKNAFAAAAKSAVSLKPVARIAEACPGCQQISFATFSPDPTYISVYGSDSVWVHTYDTLYKAPSLPGGFYNFSAGCLNFTHYADNTYGSMTYWDGFTVSKTKAVPFPCDTACSDNCIGLQSQFSSITGGGVGGASDPYLVAYYGYNEDFYPVNHATLTLGSADSICGLYVTNNAYALKSIKCGDAFFSRKFAQGDSFVITIKGFNGGTPKGSVRYFLADYRGATSAYVVDAWKWVNLKALGVVDSLAFELTTSDVGDFGPNTPMYFCIDGIKVGTDPSCGACAATDTTQHWFPIGQNLLRANATTSSLTLLVSPNPAGDQIRVSSKAGYQVELFDSFGNKKLNKKLVSDVQSISLAGFKPGTYIIRVSNGSVSKTAQFVKQ